MKAVLLYSYGDPSQLRYEETAVPRYGDDEVLVKMHATSTTRNTRSPKLTCSLRSRML
jgi:NADPH:quinone reductase-like Zn-dependent oxidoreductase